MAKPRNNKKKSNKKAAKENRNNANATNSTTNHIHHPQKTNGAVAGLSTKRKDLLDKAVEWKVEGNAAFSAKEYPKAIEAYSRGLQLLSDDASMSANDEPQQQSPTTTDTAATTALMAQLYSNRAQVHLRSLNFADAERDCNNIIIPRKSVTSSSLPQLLPAVTSKVWYRRALAREGLAHAKVKESAWAAAQTILAAAKEDLQQCLKQATSRPEDADSMNLKKAVMDVATRLAAQQVTIERHMMEASSSNGKRRVDDEYRHSHPIPSVEEQRQDIQRLLKVNKSAVVEGEAFFLIDWEWWCEWCKHVNFFDGDSCELLLPSGALQPTLDDADYNGESPGPIDNYLLLLPPLDRKSKDASPQTIYYQHWYQCYSSDAGFALKPGLVRGHHYELLPREVYSALKLWYSELTPSICRRSKLYDDTKLRVPLYTVKQAVAFGKSTFCSACGAVGATMRCKPCMSTHYCDRACQENDWKAHKVECKTIKDGKVSQRAKGRSGLNNLGNTCFMNSALQSLSHATPLTRHFLSGKFKTELNLTNPLGTRGKLTLAYEEIMKALHNSNLRNSSPTSLKRAIAMFAPRFAGCLQHDAQEFLAYLLDGLHEDLNRIKKAPYVELPDVTDGQCLSVAGALAWDAHKRRNDSLVLDTFYGQFKSTCVCPTCDSVSVSFDAFNHVSLEIPQEKSAVVPVPILVYPATSESGLTRYAVYVRRTDRLADLKERLSELCGISFSRLHICDLQESIIQRIHQDTTNVSDLSNCLIAYEAEPYSVQPTGHRSIHALATHRLLDPIGEAEAFGIPFLTSFGPELTCREVWSYLWDIVGRYVEDKEDSDGPSLLQIRLRTPRGVPLSVFPAENNNGKDDATDSDDEIMTSVSKTSSLLPRYSDDKLLAFVGEEAMDQFVFFNLEWTEPELPETGNPEVDSNESVMRIDEEKFVSYRNHESWIAAEKLEKAKDPAAGVSLDQCFETFTRPERLDKHNMWYCSKCKEHVSAMKTMELWKLPNILIIHLKRFEFKNALRRDKIDNLVSFPLDDLDVNRHCAAANEGTSFVDDGIPGVYDCFAVVNHFGRMGFGHYTAFARQWDETGISKDWASFDDSRVQSGVPGSSVISPAAYVLFYRRRTFT